MSVEEVDGRDRELERGQMRVMEDIIIIPVIMIHPQISLQYSS